MSKYTLMKEKLKAYNYLNGSPTVGHSKISQPSCYSRIFYPLSFKPQNICFSKHFVRKHKLIL